MKERKKGSKYEPGHNERQKAHYYPPEVMKAIPACIKMVIQELKEDRNTSL